MLNLLASLREAKQARLAPMKCRELKAGILNVKTVHLWWTKYVQKDKRDREAEETEWIEDIGGRGINKLKVQN
ncbi:MAG: hypothetical protein GXP43_00190 [bacterium]|nr:hypothetical protein [bacterium]